MEMSIGTIIEAVIGIVIATIVVATVLVPIVQDLTFTGDMAAVYTSLFGIVTIVAIVGVVMMAVRYFIQKN